MFSRKPLMVTFFSVLVTLLPLNAYAWNLVCGVSIGNILSEEENTAKWDADSRALKAVSNMFWAISALQRLSLEESGEVIVPRSLNNPDRDNAIEVAVKAFKESNKDFGLAIDLAEKYGLGDDKGRSLLSSLQSTTEDLVVSLENHETNGLPDLFQIHGMVRETMAFVDHGLMLSEKHLSHGLKGHGEGGAKYDTFTFE